MLHLTHRILDVFSQPRQRFFCCVTSGKCATWSNMAALLCSGLLARLLPNQPFTTATWIVQKNILRYHFLPRWSIRYSARNMPAKSTRPCICCTLLQLSGTTRRPSGAGVEGTLTSLFQIVLNFQWRVLQSVPPYRTDRVDAFLQ
ncbi:hypothetical protein Tsp_10178 [Trichinella spiralis]|uniref:hypothetical protein n=1 Tax=Trichinella spiralis TaxID=6334 RepID=UPI0001EFDBCF|nr:hypothetical protein Tsp_10178 [Trichinella spiralis]